ncbi:hypothetical protein AS9A_1250 [Hoyosella subflava DQS3-9A1]|uniref:Uncharacterized protein n=1 Tax=Hoyosella subflava (strain DSM 45089 / JCM 17490 / NBRC 109087 / DQS3-9A1) TaxID=443218 RepID=F6EEK5_HOYSD|nr:hypothetical protein AS9A_1250 [Hoyosella subflava DQS3-9A1]
MLGASVQPASANVAVTITAAPLAANRDVVVVGTVPPEHSIRGLGPHAF